MSEDRLLTSSIMDSPISTSDVYETGICLQIRTPLHREDGATV